MTFNEWKIKQRQSHTHEYAFYDLLIFKLLNHKDNYINHLVKGDYHTYIAIALLE